MSLWDDKPSIEKFEKWDIKQPPYHYLNEDVHWLLSQLAAKEAEIARLREAANGILSAIEIWNISVEAIIGRQTKWRDQIEKLKQALTDKGGAGT